MQESLVHKHVSDDLKGLKKIARWIVQAKEHVSPAWEHIRDKIRYGEEYYIDSYEVKNHTTSIYSWVLIIIVIHAVKVAKHRI